MFPEPQESGPAPPGSPSTPGFSLSSALLTALLELFLLLTETSSQWTKGCL